MRFAMKIFTLFGCSPYNIALVYMAIFYSKWMLNIDYLDLRERLNNPTLAIIHQYQLDNLYYWRDHYSTEKIPI